MIKTIEWTDEGVVMIDQRLLPGEEQYTVEIKQRGTPRTAPTGDIMHDVYMWSHSGTHVEVSLHFYAGGKDTSDFPPETFVGPAIRLDMAQGLSGNEDFG